MAFDNIDVAILVGAMPRKEGMERKDLLKANAKIFVAQVMEKLWMKWQRKLQSLKRLTDTIYLNKL